MAPCTSCLLLRSFDCCSQHFCDVCKYMFTMDPGNGHNNWFSNCVFKVYAYCHHCSTVHEVQNILGSTMLCLSNSSLSNTIHHSGAVMTEGIHFEYTIWASIIMPIASIHSEHVFAYITEVLRAVIGWSCLLSRSSNCHAHHCHHYRRHSHCWLL